MKIVAVLEYSMVAGGAFSEGLSALLRVARICKGRFDFEVFTTHAENIGILRDHGLTSSFIRLTFLDNFLGRAGLNPWWQLLQSRLEILGPFERKLMRHNADLVYFLTQSPSPASLQQLNYMTTVFDLCHRDAPEFPEVRSFGKLLDRERHFKNNLAGAFLIVTESDLLSERVSRRYGIDRERCLTIPMSPSPLLRDGSGKNAMLTKYGLEEGYFFYPAQFWSHKNHIRILEALVHLRESGDRLRVVFTGADKGNLRHVESCVGRLALRDQVRFLGFVPPGDMRGLYEGAIGVVMPTYFGPTNLPPLEAWMIGRPLIYSSPLKEQVGEAAICVNPDDSRDLANAMRACTDPGTVDKLVRAGAARLKTIEDQRTAAETALIDRFRQFEARRRCWP